ncbi:glycosyltransferase [Bacillus timonensis]|uniref:glycosyltransferase n=1 Tax=Bacillus timonensis TaxID=1033734 RepID=UPI00028927A5|nr:glycosyltransferase [Bacillus timonensis]
MKRERVLVISNMYPSESSPTFGIFVKNQVEALREQGLTVDVVAIQNPDTQRKGILTKYMMWMLKAFFLLFVGYRYKVVHAHYVFPSGVLGLVYKKIWKSKFVVTAHGGDIHKMAKINRITGDLTKLVLTQADHVIAVGQTLYQEIHQEYGVGTSKLSIISMGVNRSVFMPQSQENARKIIGKPNGEQMILFVGNLIEAKGVKELIQAFEQVKEVKPNASLHLIGRVASESFYNQVQQMVAENGLADVFFHGPMSQKDVANWMAASDVFVLPSYNEGFGLVALEAMSCHTPVVASDVGGLSFLLADGAGILIKPKDSGSLYDGLMEVLENETLRQELVKKGEILAKENDQNYLLSKILEIYGDREKSRALS